MQRQLASFLALAVTLFPPSLLAHSGGLNAEGCHTDRKNGGYHCHQQAAKQIVATPGNNLKAAPSGSSAFANCAEARAAGAAPVRAGDPGYNRKLDRDGDGLACE